MLAFELSDLYCSLSIIIPEKVSTRTLTSYYTPYCGYAYSYTGVEFAKEVIQDERRWETRSVEVIDE